MRPALLTALIIATALFMENLDGTVLVDLAAGHRADLHQDPIVLKLALTSYMLTLAVFIPASGWVADRFGARTVFCSAIVVFTLGSILCGASTSLPTLIAARIFQGLGGAMMVPVGRLVLLRIVPKREIVNALAYLTVPALIGPVPGPPLGGFITTYFHWRWIFWINVPIGVLGVASVAVDSSHNLREEMSPRFDFKGFVLVRTRPARAHLRADAYRARHRRRPRSRSADRRQPRAARGLCAARGQNADAILDLKLLRIPTFFAGVVGGLLFRIGIGALPFLLPLLLQIGFGLTPFESGSLTFAAALGAMAMKFTASTALRWFGFRRTLIANALISGAFLASYALFTPSTPHWLIFLALLAGGFFRSLEFTALNAISYADIDPPRMSRATSFASVSQQMSGAVGVAVAAICIQVIQVGFGDKTLYARDLSTAFVLVAIVSSLSTFIFIRLKPDAGAALSGRAPAREEGVTAAAE